MSTNSGIQVIYGDNQSALHPNYIADIVYANHGGIDLHIDMLTQAKKGDRFPCLVYVQGSGWQKQLTKLYLPKMMPFAFAGYVVACVEYRTAEEAPFPAQIQDARAAVRFLRAHAEDYGIDPEHIALMGDSSGGHTVLMASIADGFLEDTPDYPAFSSKVNCVIDFYAPTDLLARGMDARWDGIDPDRMRSFAFRADTQEGVVENLKKANPLAYISADRPLPPILIMHGDRDPLVPFSQSELLFEKLRETGHEVEFFKIAGAGHGIGFWIDPVYKTCIGFLHAYICQKFE